MDGQNENQKVKAKGWGTTRVYLLIMKIRGNPKGVVYQEKRSRRAEPMNIMLKPKNYSTKLLFGLKGLGNFLCHKW